MRHTDKNYGEIMTSPFLFKGSYGHSSMIKVVTMVTRLPLQPPHRGQSPTATLFWDETPNADKHLAFHPETASLEACSIFGISCYKTYRAYHRTRWAAAKAGKPRFFRIFLGFKFFFRFLMF